MAFWVTDFLSIKNTIAGALKKQQRIEQMGYEHARFLLGRIDSAFDEIKFEWEKEIDPSITKQELKEWIANHQAKEALNRSKNHGTNINIR